MLPVAKHVTYAKDRSCRVAGSGPNKLVASDSAFGCGFARAIAGDRLLEYPVAYFASQLKYPLEPYLLHIPTSHGHPINARG